MGNHRSRKVSRESECDTKPAEAAAIAGKFPVTWTEATPSATPIGGWLGGE